MQIIEFIIQGQAVAKARPRVCAGKTYTPLNTRWWEESVCFQSKVHAPKKPFSGAVSIDCSFHLLKPKYLGKKEIPHTKKSDLDNLFKSIADGLEKAGFYNNDSQINKIKTSKEYGPGVPHVWIIIEGE